MMNGNDAGEGPRDEVLVKRCQRGDRKAFELLFQRYQRRVYHIVLHFLGDPSESDDVSQEVFIQVFRSIRSFRGDSTFYTWLYRIVVNLTKNRIKQKVRQRWMYRETTDEILAQIPAERSGSASLSPEREVQRRELGSAIRGELLALNENYRMALILREIEGLSYEEIGKIMKVRAGTVKSKIARGRLVLQEKLRSFL